MADKYLLLTMRQDIEPAYHELRDGLDTAWWTFLDAAGFVPIPLPNHLGAATAIVKQLPHLGVVLTGGGTHQVDGQDPRSQIERMLIQRAVELNTPLLGVCRGMQAIQQYFGLTLQPVTGHVQQVQAIRCEQGIRQVNSYHDFGTAESVPELLVQARSEDGVVKAVQHLKRHLRGVMWHPERFEIPQVPDLELFRQHFGDQ